jgi:hypothetical protein
MKEFKQLKVSSLFLSVSVLAMFLLCPTGARAQQYLTVDCTGANPSAYPSINAALPNALPGAFILVTGPCTENVNLNQVSNLNLGAYYGQTAVLNGGINITNSDNVTLYGLNVTNTSGNGISVSSSRGTQLNVCSSSGNFGLGLNVNGMSDVTVGASGAFSHNGSYGIDITGNSLVAVVAWAGPVDISNNVGAGIWSSQGNFSTLGPTTINNNVSNGSPNTGFGIILLGGARAQIGALFGPNVVSGNPGGGASVGENAEISFWNIGPSNQIQNNGPVGVSAGLHSQVTFYDISGPVGVVITDHTSAGVELYAGSQANFFGVNQIMRNGSASDSRSAGIRLDGNSEMYMRGGQVTQNNGPGILALVNSSADFTGVTFSGNAQGQAIACDTSSWMVSDLTKLGAYSPAGVACRTPHLLGNRGWLNAFTPNTDWSGPKARFDRYAKAAVKH